MNKSLIIKFVKQELVYRYSGSLLGAIWSFIFPLINIMIFILVFSKLIGARIPLPEHLTTTEYSYSVYLVAGMLSWNCFAATFSRIANVFTEKSGIISKINLSLLHLPLYIIITEMIIYGISLAIFLIFLISINMPISLYWLWIPVILILQQGFAYTLGLFFAMLGVFIKDIRQAIEVGVQIWFWLTPIVYVIAILPEAYQHYFYFNPAYSFISSYQAIILYLEPPSMNALLSLFVSIIILGLINSKLMKILEKDIRDLL